MAQSRQSRKAKRTRRSYSEELKQDAMQMLLRTTDAWVNSYYNPNDLHCIDRILFGT